MNSLDIDAKLNKAIEEALASGDPNVHHLIDLRARADHANADVELADLAISKQLNIEAPVSPQAVSATYTITIPAAQPAITTNGVPT